MGIMTFFALVNNISDIYQEAFINSGSLVFLY